MQVVEDCSETDGVHSAGTKAKLSIYLSREVFSAGTKAKLSISLSREVFNRDVGCRRLQ